MNQKTILFSFEKEERRKKEYPIKCTYYLFQFMLNSGKYKLIYNDQKENSGCLRMVVIGRHRREGLQKSKRKILEVMCIFVVLTLEVVSHVYRYVKT